MPPPPPANMPLGQRLMTLVQTLQFGWYLCHVILCFCTLRYGLSYITFNYNSFWAQTSYRIGFVAAATTYGIVVYKSFRARMRAAGGMPKQGDILRMAGDENVQYFIMALVWLFYRQMPLALLPFTIYSIFHALTYTRLNLIPTIQPRPVTTTTSPGKPGAKKSGGPIADAIGDFIKQYYDASMTMVAAFEILLWFRVLSSAIMFVKGSWVLLVIYSIFLRARHNQSSFVQGAISQGVARGDALVANQSTPPPVRQIWQTLKGIVKQIADATDINRYIGSAQPGMKKAS
ncbi:MAG: hypothetical protein MMC33_001915 [Icmadophila ericetorum]|nr:hypothetical protein [Icmadophila ericetorum]